MSQLLAVVHEVSTDRERNKESHITYRQRGKLDLPALALELPQAPPQPVAPARRQQRQHHTARARAR